MKIRIFPKVIYGFYFIGLTGEFLIYEPTKALLYADRKGERKGWHEFKIDKSVTGKKMESMVLEAIFLTGEKLGDL